MPIATRRPQRSLGRTLRALAGFYGKDTAFYATELERLVGPRGHTTHRDVLLVDSLKR